MECGRRIVKSLCVVALLSGSVWAIDHHPPAVQPALQAADAASGEVTNAPPILMAPPVRVDGGEESSPARSVGSRFTRPETPVAGASGSRAKMVRPAVPTIPGVASLVPAGGRVPGDDLQTMVQGGSGSGVQSAADHIVNQQCIDGGWGWPHDDCTVTYNNITGPIALGLLQAYEITADASHRDSAEDGGDFDLTSQYGNGEARFGTHTPYFLWQLSAAIGTSTHSDFAATDFFDELTAGTYGPSDYDTAGWIALVEAARAGTWINLLPWEFQTLGVTAEAIGNAGQNALFNQAVLDGLNTLDNTAPATVFSDLLGVAGGVRGLALNGTTSFTAIVSPKHAGINGISTLCALADQLVSYQNGDGSWYWHSALGAPAEGDKDSQTTAYAVLALLAADELCTDYSGDIDDARDWLWSMQDPDGGFKSYPGGSHNTEVEGEVLQAMTPPAEVFVDDDFCDGCANDGHQWGFDAFDNIQDGVNAVGASTVNVAAGTYEEQLSITKDLTLTGAGQGSTTITSPDALAVMFNANAADRRPIVFVGGDATVTIEQLTVDGLGKGNANPQIMGIGFHNAGGTVDDVRITRVRDGGLAGPLTGVQHGVGLTAFNDDASARSVTISGCTIDDFQKNAMALVGPDLTVTVSGNTITGVGATLITAQNGVQLASGATGAISGNTITGIGFTGPSWAATSILLLDATGTTVTGNIVTLTGSTGGDFGAYNQGGDNVLVSGNTFDGIAYPVIALDGAGLTITGNDMVNVFWEVFLYGPVSGATITNNSIIGSLDAAIFVWDSDDSGTFSTHTIRDNEFSGSAWANAGIIDAAFAAPPTTGVLDMSRNYWGSSDPTTVAGTIFGTSAIDFSPILVNGDTDGGAVGFVPDLSVLTVHLEGAQTTGLVQEGVDMVTASTVNVAAGTYVERVTITKSLDLLGAQAGVDPTPFGARTNPAAESIITEAGLGTPNPDILIEIPNGVTDVSIDGFTLVGDPTNPVADTSTIRCWDDDITISNNIMDGLRGVLYKGAVGLTVSQNRVTASKNGVIIQPSPATDATISDNVFTRGPNPPGDESAIFISGTTDSKVTGNTATGWITGKGVGGSNHTNLEVSGNTFTGNKDAVSFWGTTTFVTIKENVLSGNSRYGISIKGQDITIENNQITGNGNTGVNIDRHVIDTERVSVNYNTITGNGSFGVKVNTATVLEVIDAENNFWGDDSGPADAAGTTEVPPCNADSADDVNADGTGDSVTDKVDYCPWLDAPATLTLVADRSCYEVSDPVVVSVEMSSSKTVIVGGQFRLDYDNTVLGFKSADPGDAPFVVEVHEDVDQGAGTIEYATGVVSGEAGTAADTVMARITFNALVEMCDAADNVSFRTGDPDPPTRLSDSVGGDVIPQLNNLAAFKIDQTAPEISGLTVSDEKMDGDCDATVTFSATVTDTCCVDAGDVTVVVTLPSGNATLSNIVINKVQNGQDQVDVSGSADVSDLTSCPATVVVTIDAVDCCGNPATQAQDSGDVTDNTLPVITCPSNINVNADAGLCTAVVDPGTATATDNCDGTPTIVGVRDDGGALNDPYPSGVTTITWTATDDCGNEATCDQTITVNAVNDLVVEVELDGGIEPGPFTRCITFELWECGPNTFVVAEDTLTFVNGLASATVEVACGAYTCITARDTLHTLRRTDDDDFGVTPIVGTQYVADFTDKSGAGGDDDSLIGANFNDDLWVDILDFGVFNSQFGINYGSGDTTCATSFPHADVNGDGLVDNVEFGFIFSNFFVGSDANCCGAGGVASEGEGPMASISVEELRRRGLGHLAAGDLNGDGMLDQADIAAFAQGARPVEQSTRGLGLGKEGRSSRSSR